jgi:hypothetical protein
MNNSGCAPVLFSEMNSPSRTHSNLELWVKHLRLNARGTVKFESPGRHQQLKKRKTEFDAFNKTMLGENFPHNKENKSPLSRHTLLKSL